MTALAYEARRLGWTAVLAPPSGVAALCLFAWLAARLGNFGQVDRILTAIVQVSSVAGGISAVVAVAPDPALELRLSLPISLRRSVAVRVAMALGWAAAVAAIATQTLHATAHLTSEIPGAPAADQLEWLAPMLMLAGLGVLAAVSLRVTAAGVALVGTVWVLTNALSGLWRQVPWLTPIWSAFPFDPAHPSDWYANRFWLATIGATTLAVAGWLLARPDHLLGGDR